MSLPFSPVLFVASSQARLRSSWCCHAAYFDLVLASHNLDGETLDGSVLRMRLRVAAGP